MRSNNSSMLNGFGYVIIGPDSKPFQLVFLEGFGSKKTRWEPFYWPPGSLLQQQIHPSPAS